MWWWPPDPGHDHTIQQKMHNGKISIIFFRLWSIRILIWIYNHCLSATHQQCSFDKASLTNVSHSAIWHTLISTLIWSLSLRQTGPVVYHRPHLIIFGSRPWKEVMRLSNIYQWEAWNVFHVTNELWWCMCDHLSIILGARGYSCKFSAPGHTITGPALTWSSHLCTVMPSPIVHWCPGQPGPRVTRNSEPGLNVWWMQSDELVSCEDQWGDSIRVPRPVRQVTIPVEVSQWKPW